MKDYWKNRQRQLQRSVEKDEQKLKKRLARIYKAEAKRLEKEIAYWYQTYGEDGVIEYRKMMQKLSEDEREALLRMIPDGKDPQYLQEWFEALTGNKSLSANRMFEIRNAIYKLNRLEGLQTSVLLRLSQIAEETNSLITEHMTNVAIKSINSTTEAFGYGNGMYMVNSEIMKNFVDVAWSNGQNFSSIIWGNTEKLAKYLNTDIAQGIARGDSYQRLASHIRQRFEKVSRRDAYRLIFTEGTYIMNEASMKPFEDDFEYYSIITVGDKDVCDHCNAIQTQSQEHPFKIADRVAGENFPPFHPWCRCTFKVEVNWDEWLERHS